MEPIAQPVPAQPVAPSPYVRLRLKTTRPTEFIDITDHLTSFVRGIGRRTGLLNVQTLHTTTAVVVNEHEPLLLSDFARLLGELAPGARAYSHDDPAQRRVNLTPDERTNGHAHCRALLLPTSVCLTVVDGSLLLGRWQRVFFAELDGPQPRELSLLFLAEAAR